MPNVNPNSTLFSNKLSKEAQTYKKSVPLSDEGLQVAIAIAFSDATVYNTPGRGAVLKVEQGAEQLEFVLYLFAILMHISWNASPEVRYELAKDGSGKTLYSEVLDSAGQPEMRTKVQPSGEATTEPRLAAVKTSTPKSYSFRT